MEGLTPHGVSNGGAEPQAASSNLADQLVASALRYRGQAPLIDAILKEIGMSGGDLKGLTKALEKDQEEPPEEK